MHVLLALSALAAIASATSRVAAPAGAITVGSGKTFTTIQKAVDSLSTTSKAAQSIFIYPGIYVEQVLVPSRTASLSIYGYTEDTSSYAANQVTLTHNESLLTAASDDATGTVRNFAAKSAFYNINIKNTYGKGAQAIALSAQATDQGYYGVGLYGYQDTLLSETGNQVFAKCYIEGAVDFIFGQHARTWIDGSDLRIRAGGGCITANGRPSSADVSYYVINKSTVAAAAGASIGSGTVFLGRPWRQYARVQFQGTTLSSIINSAGWKVWQPATPQISNVSFTEYHDVGPGAGGTRAPFASQANSAISITTLLGSSYTSWVDTGYLS